MVTLFGVVNVELFAKQHQRIANEKVGDVARQRVRNILLQQLLIVPVVVADIDVVVAVMVGSDVEVNRVEARLWDSPTLVPGDRISASLLGHGAVIHRGGDH